MELTRTALKRLIAEAIKERSSVLLEMPMAGEAAYEYDRTSNDSREESGAACGALKKDLFHMSQKTQQLHDMLGDDEQLPYEVESKIGEATRLIGTIFDDLMYERRPGHIKE